MNTRRGFLGALLGGAAALAFDPEKLLYVPGKKKIFIPSRTVYSQEFVVTAVVESNIDFELSLEQFRQNVIAPAAQKLSGEFDRALMRGCGLSGMFVVGDIFTIAGPR